MDDQLLDLIGALGWRVSQRDPASGPHVTEIYQGEALLERVLSASPRSLRDLAAIWLPYAEAEIARRGLQEQYMESLAAELGGALYADPYGAGLMRDSYGDHWLDTEFLWRTFTAPPDARVRAMLAVLSH